MSLSENGEEEAPISAHDKDRNRRSALYDCGEHRRTACCLPLTSSHSPLVLNSMPFGEQMEVSFSSTKSNRSTTVDSNYETVLADIGTLNFPFGMQLNIGSNIQAGSVPPTAVSTGTVPISRRVPPRKRRKAALWRDDLRLRCLPAGGLGGKNEAPLEALAVCSMSRRGRVLIYRVSKLELQPASALLHSF